MPKRIQRRRTKGWRLPPNAVCVTRPGKYGNPFKVGCHYRRGGMNSGHRFDSLMIYVQAYAPEAGYTTIRTSAEAVEWFQWLLSVSPHRRDQIRKELRGKDLACFCPLDMPCHADVLLEVANA